MIASLMLGTLIVGALLAAFLLVRFLRQSGNRHPMEDQRERNIGEIQRGEPPAAG